MWICDTCTECQEGPPPASKRLLPRIKLCPILPQWITSSDVGAYHPLSRTAFIRTRGVSKARLLYHLSHEVGHHVIHLCGGQERHHWWYDDLCFKWLHQTGVYDPEKQGNDKE